MTRKFWDRTSTLVGLLALTIGVIIWDGGSSAQASTVEQGAGSPTVIEWTINASARFGGKSSQVLVLSTAGGTAVPATALVGRKAIEIQNLGPNAIYCTVDGSSPVVTTLGRMIPTNGSWSLDAGPTVAVKCISAVSQASGAATQVTELK